MVGLSPSTPFQGVYGKPWIPRKLDQQSDGHTSNLEETGDLALIHAHELLQSIDKEREVLRILDKLLPLKALRKRTHRRLRLNPRGDARDNDRPVGHFETTDDLCFASLKEGREGDGKEDEERGWRQSGIGASYLYRVCARFALHAMHGLPASWGRPGV